MKGSLNVNTLEYTDSTGKIHQIEGRLSMPQGIIAEDVHGTPILVGDFVSYPVRHGSNMWIESGIVVQINDRNGWDSRTNYAGKIPVLVVQKPKSTKCVKVTRLDRVIVTERGPVSNQEFEFFDSIGNYINVGDFIAYPTQENHTLFQTIAKVLDFKGKVILVKRVVISGLEVISGPENVYIRRLDNIVKVNPHNARNYFLAKFS